MLQFLFRLLLLIIITLTTGCHGRTKAEWKSRVLYQLLTDRFSQSDADPDVPCQELRGWCNGTWKGIVRHLDYLQNLGIDAIWISPIVENTDGGYHGYWAKNIFKLNDHFGNEADLLALVDECHRRNIWVMVDVVPNHMGYPKNCSYSGCSEDYRNNFQEFVPFNETVHYHEYCEISWPTDNQTEIEVCRLAYLVDLNQTVPYVRDTLYDWIHNMTLDYGFDGYRIDTVRHISIDFWPGYQESAGAYCVGEVAEKESIDYLANYQSHGGLDGVLNFHLHGVFSKVFQNNASMTLLKTSIEEERVKFLDVRALGTFVDNHDMPRFLNTTTDQVLFKNALTYIFFGEGIPIIYYGTEQGFSGGGDPNCRESLWPYYDQSHELYQFIQMNLNFRRVHVSTIVSTPQVEIYDDDNSMVFTKGDNQLIVIITNMGMSQSQMKTFPVSKPDGTVYENVFDPSDVVVVSGGQLTVGIVNGQPKVYLIRETVSDTAAQYCVSAFLFATCLLSIVRRHHYRMELGLPCTVQT